MTLLRALRLRCPRCGLGRLFSGLFRMHEACPACGASFRREQGFYLGSISINYGFTVLGTGGLYALLVLACGWSHRAALAACLVAAVVFPVWFFRWARSLLLALDGSVNRQQAADADAPGGLEALAGDDGRAGCAMGVALALILLFGIGMAVVTIVFTVDAAGAEQAAADCRQAIPRLSSRAITAATHFATDHSCVGSTRSGSAGGS
ncbi:MAG: DUF983 domain-containing protein [Planctomycetaceae bacterium]